jgi:hypothetical protein
MTDIFDQAQALEQQQLEQALLAQAAKAIQAPQLVPTGYCQNPKCGEEFITAPPGIGTRLFCNAICASEHARLTRKL